MAKKRRVDASLLGALVAGAKTQEIQKGTPRTYDPNFPIFATPVNQDVIVYIPKTNVVTTEVGEDMKYLPAHIHDYRNGKQFGQLRCINGLSGAGYEALGYDGTCPVCEATQECWELYNHKMKAEAQRLGIDPGNDPGDILKSARDKILGEMTLKNVEEYVVFPVVIIPTVGKMKFAPDAAQNMQVQFVVWRKQRYEENILAALDTLMENPGHPAGLFWQWKFTYDTKGKQANARDSAKNAKYTIITDAAAHKVLEQFTPVAEEKAKEFTLVKAAEVVTAVEFLYHEDLEAEVNKVMVNTRKMLTLINSGDTGVQQIVAQPTNALLGLGQPVGDMGTAGPVNIN